MGGSYSQTVYSPGGGRLGTVQGTTLLQGLVPLPGGRVARVSVSRETGAPRLDF